MESKEEILNTLGKRDGLDNKRWDLACEMSKKQDIHVNFAFESLINLETKELIQFNKITLEDCVNQCYSNDSFIKEFNRLNNATLKTSNHFYNEIDIATGKRKEDLEKFVQVVDLTVYQPLLNRK